MVRAGQRSEVGHCAAKGHERLRAHTQTAVAVKGGLYVWVFHIKRNEYPPHTHTHIDSK